MWFIMSTKIKRYDTETCVSHGYGGVPYVEFVAYDDGEYVRSSDLIEFTKQFPKDHVVRTTLLEALGEQDAT